MLEQSFHSVGLNQLLASVNVPKGSFYHYFKSKEELGVELVRQFAANDNAQRRKILTDQSLEENPIQRLFVLWASVIDKLQESGGKCPCLLQKLGNEVANYSDAMREELAKGFRDAIGIFQLPLDEAVEKGLLPAEMDTAAEASFIIDFWAGAHQRAIISRDPQPLLDALELFRARLLTHPKLDPTPAR